MSPPKSPQLKFRDPLSTISHRKSTGPLKAATLRGGFSLVEVIMALGIFTFAIVGIIGLIPIALQTHLDAKFGTIQAQIHQRLAAEVLLTDFSKLQDLDGKVRYFDEEGLEVFAGNTAQRPTIFTSKTVVATASLPPAYSSASMSRVIFYAIHDPAGKGITPTTKPTGSILVAKTAPTI